MNEEELSEKFVFYNPWWQKHQVPLILSPSFKRPIFEQLIHYLSLERIIILKGPRRTGKSTLMYQLIDQLIKTGTHPATILYLNFEDPLLRTSLFDLFRLFEKLLLEPLEYAKPKYIFLDEIHLLPGWASSLKAFFDKKYPLKFICSGSAASLIHKSSESLAGRTIEEIIYPFNFREWANFHLVKEGQKENIDAKNYLLYKKQIDLLWEKYLVRGGFAHLLEIEDLYLLQKLVYEDVVQKVIYKDLVDLYGIREPSVLEKVFYYLINTSGHILHLTDLGNTIGLNRETLRSYLSYLKQAFLYFDLSKYSRSVKQTLSSSAKIHLVDPVFFILTPERKQSFIWETTIASYMYQKHAPHIFYWREREEVDLVWQNAGTLIPIEVKSGKNVMKKDLKGLIKCLDRFSTKEGWVLYGGEDKKETIGARRIKFFNAAKFIYLNL